jgi:hypothetical protein
MSHGWGGGRRTGARWATGRQRGQLDGRRSRRLGRQIDADGFFLRLDLAGFFFRGQRASWRIRNIFGHKKLCGSKISRRVSLSNS